MAKVTQTEWKGSKVWSGCVPLLWLALATFIAGSLGCKSSSPLPKNRGRAPSAPRIVSVVHLGPFVVNLADPEENRFLRVGIDLGLENPFSTKGIKSGEGEVPTARVRDCILGVLTTWHSDDLLVPEGKQKLKDELVHALRERAPELGVREVYFNDFLVQR